MSAVPPDRSIRQAAPTIAPGCSRERLQAFARREARGDDVLDHQHACAGGDLEAAPEPEDAVLALDEDRLGAEPARRLVAGHDAADRGRGDDVDRPERLPRLRASARQSRSVRAGSWNTDIFCRKTGECSPDDRMKWPSSSAPAARNSSSA